MISKVVRYHSFLCANFFVNIDFYSKKSPVWRIFKIFNYLRIRLNCVILNYGQY